MSRIIFITGASSGIGKACAETFARNKDFLILNGRREEKLQTLKNDLEKQYGAKVYCLPFDVRNKDAVKAQVESLPEGWTGIDVLINNAGLAAGKDAFGDADFSDWETMISTNVLGLLYVTRSLLPSILQQKGQIINIGSIAGDVAYAGGSVYCASKAAVDILSDGMRIDLLQHKIKVTNIKPGAAETEFSMVRFKGDAARAAETYRGYTPLTAEDVAKTIFYCTSLPPHVCINELTITCTAQANSFYTFKESLE